MGKNRRKKYYVGESGQRGLLIGTFFLILILIVVASSLFYLLANRDLESAAYKAHFETLHNTMDMLLPWLILVNAIGLVVVIILAVFFTHKISGPAYHLMKDLEQLRDGNLTVRTNLRKGDKLKGLSDSFNEAVTGLREIVAEIKIIADEIEPGDKDSTQKDDRILRLKTAASRLKTS